MITHHVTVVFHIPASLLGVVDLVVIATSGHVQVVQGEGPEGGVESVADVVPDLGRVEEPCALHDGLHHV